MVYKNMKMMEINSNVTILTININELNLLFKIIFSDWIFHQIFTPAICYL